MAILGSATYKMSNIVESEIRENRIHLAAKGKLYGVPACNPDFQVGAGRRQYVEPRVTVDRKRITCRACLSV